MYKPIFTMSLHLLQVLNNIETLKQEIALAIIDPIVFTSLKEAVSLYSTRYSTYIEGNRLNLSQIQLILHYDQHIPERAYEEKEVRGYYNAFQAIIQGETPAFNSATIHHLHELVMDDIKNSPSYRTVENAIRESLSGALVYLPPQPKDVPILMQELLTWVSSTTELAPIKAAIIHYQIATIHPYLDGNGRMARLLTMLSLYHDRYGLYGLYYLEEYYVKNLMAYYKALDIGPSYNYYDGRANADITSWIEYFCQGMLESLKKAKNSIQKISLTVSSELDQELPKLSFLQRKIFPLFIRQTAITSKDIEKLFNLKPRTARLLCQTWTQEGFLVIIDSAKKSRKYALKPILAALTSYPKDI